MPANERTSSHCHAYEGVKRSSIRNPRIKHRALFLWTPGIRQASLPHRGDGKEWTPYIRQRCRLIGVTAESGVYPAENL